MRSTVHVFIIIDLGLTLLQYCRASVLRHIKPTCPIVAREVVFQSGRSEFVYHA